MMKNNVSHADIPRFLEKLDAGSGKSKIQKFISMIIFGWKGIFPENFSQIGQKCLKNWFSGFPDILDPRYRILFW